MTGPTGQIDETTYQILLLCLRARWDPAALAAARALVAQAAGSQRAPDWQALGRVALAERLGPLLYGTLRKQDLLPSPLERTLQQHYYHNAKRNILLFAELERVLQRLSAAAISPILLKGAALAPRIYVNSALRPLGDVDLLVREGDVPDTLRLLIEQGYTPTPPTTYRNETLLHKPGQPPHTIEVHWGLLAPAYYQYTVPMDGFWETARPATIGQTPAQVLGPEAQLLHLCAHLVLHHAGGELLWLHDVAEAVVAYRDEDLDWDRLISQARAWRLVRPVQQVLARVSADWQAPIPPAVLERLGDLRPSPEEERVLTAITSAQGSAGRRLWAELRSMPAWGPRLRFLGRSLFPPPGYVRHCHTVPHPLLVPLYYPYRWLLGLRRALSSR